MMYKKTILIIILLLASSYSNATSPPLDAAEQGKFVEQLAKDYSSSLSFECLDMEITGGCIWATFHLFNVSIRFSPVVSMYSPDAKVEVFHTNTNTPYIPAKINDMIASKIGNLLSYITLPGVDADNLSSKEGGYRSVHLMGNPILKLHQKTMKSLFNTFQLSYCESVVKPFKTYFHSDVDWLEWRIGILEEFLYPTVGLNLDSLNPLAPFRQVFDKISFSQWGTLYPRTGWTNNASPYIAATIAALRAGNIVTNHKEDNAGLHIAKQLPTKLIHAKSFSNPIVDEKNGRWQPTNIGDSYMNKCTTFPTPRISIPTGTLEPYKASRSYIFTLWRKYTCCTRKGDKFIGMI